MGYRNGLLGKSNCDSTGEVAGEWYEVAHHNFLKYYTINRIECGINITTGRFGSLVAYYNFIGMSEQPVAIDEDVSLKFRVI